MTLHRVLSELKTLVKRINNGVVKLDADGKRMHRRKCMEL